jgi:hypothetical protein
MELKITFHTCIQVDKSLRITVLQNILHMSKDSYFEDTKGVIRIHKSKDRQHTGQNKKDKQRSTKHYTEKTKDRATQTPLKTRGQLMCSEE